MITRKLEIIAGSSTLDLSFEHKAIDALLPHAASLEQLGDQNMLGALSRIARASGPYAFMWQSFGQYADTLLNGPTPPSLNRAVVLLSPCMSWDRWDENLVSRWAATVSATPYSEEIGWSVIDTLLQLARTVHLSPYIPADVWARLKEQPSLPPVCMGRRKGTNGGVVRRVRRLGDLDVLKSYFLLVWSEWDPLGDFGFVEMQVSIVKDLGGIGAQHHREDLIDRLDYVLGQLDRGFGYLKRHQPWLQEHEVNTGKEQYKTLRKLLVEVDQKAMESLTGMSQVDLFQRTH